MNIRLVAFASAREVLGAGETLVELPEGADLATLEAVLKQRHPDLVELWPRLAVAVDGRLARENSALAEGQEIALLPPVSGGGVPRAALVDGPIDVASLVGAVESDRRGAVITFLGNVRNHDGDRSVVRLTYEAYRSMALAALERIVDELRAGGDGLAVAIHHRLGAVDAGDTSVAIVVASPHRDAAYAASRTALERLKKEVPIWKREEYDDGESRWREEETLAGVAEVEPA